MKLSLNVSAIVLLLAAFCVACDFKQSSRPSALTAINQTKKLKVGYVVFPPCIIKDPKSGELSGHFVETIKEISKQAGWSVEFQEADWSTFTVGLNARRYDLSIAPTFTTIPRATSVTFTQPLFFAGNSAVVKKGETRFTTIGSIDQEGVIVAVTVGEAGHEYAKQHFKKVKLIEHPGSDQSLAFAEVLAGRADVALGDAYVTAQFVKEHNNVVIDLFSKNPYNLTPVSWAVRHEDQDLLNFLNSSIAALESQGKLEALEQASGANWLHPRTIWGEE